MRQRSRLSDATWTAFTEAIRYVVVPIVLVRLITNNYPQLKTAFLPEIETYILFLGGMITAASTLEMANKPGTFKRMLFGISALGFVCLWLFVIFGGGIASFSYGAYFVRFDMSKIVYIMLFGISLKGLLVISTYSTHKRYLEEQERQKRREVLQEKAAARPKLATKRRPAVPVFSSMSRVAYEVTPDDSVGYFTPRPPAPPQAHGTPAQRTLAYKQCPICGAKASLKETTCKKCGAWFPKDSLE